MLNRIVDAYLSFAEIQAKSEKSMTMKDWVVKLDEYLALLGKGILKNAGSVSAEEAEKRVSQEYELYKKDHDNKYLSDFDREVKKLEVEVNKSLKNSKKK